jgi:hypothetical protein
VNLVDVSRHDLAVIGDALSTAEGVCDIVNRDRKPVDLQACWAEIRHALDLVDSLLEQEAKP